MTWERALEADARLAAKNAVKIRAALAQSFDAKQVFEQYLATHPAVSDKPAQDRARARAWVMLNVRVNMEALKEVMIRVWAEGYVTGEAFANEQVRMATELKKAVEETYIDWASWKPGDQASALLLRPPKAFQQLLGSQGITFKDFSDTTVRDIGNAVADAVELGMNAERSAKNIMRYVASPARALSIAITEQNRAISQATINRYKESEIEKIEWQTSSPCDRCAQNQGQVIQMGGTFNSGASQPPQHPHCRCVLLPVIPDFDAPEQTGGTVTAPTMDQAGVIQHQAFDIAPTFPATAGTWKQINEEDWIATQEARRIRKKLDPANDTIKQIMRDQFNDAAFITSNGVHTIRVDKTATSIEQKHIDAFIKNVDATIAKLPEWRRFDADGAERGYTFVVQPMKKAGVSAYTYMSHDSIWVNPKDVIAALPDTPNKNYGGWFMQSSNTTNENLYTIAHEFGHTLDGHFNVNKGRFIGGLKRKYGQDKSGKGYFSRYSKKNPEEFYAEMFAEWVWGDRTNPMVAAMAEKFGWNLSLADYYEVIPEEMLWRERKVFQ
jgi:SPP1 gp7 family putative phage head morphogenesis protein